MARRNRSKLKRVFIIFSLLCCFSACRSQIQRERETPISSNSENLPAANKTSSSNIMTRQNSNLNLQSKAEATSDSKSIIVLSGAIEFDSDELNPLKEWRDDDSDTPKIRLGMTFDVLNCAGYIGQARIVKNLYEEKGYYGWQLEFLSKTIRSDFEQAIKQCSNNIEPLNASAAFAVYPSKPERQNIKTQNQPTAEDLKALYNSLSDEQKKWRATRNKERAPEFYEMLENDYDWADSDGDGKIDLITINGACNGIPNGELSCFKILHLVNGEWKEVARITPA